MKIENSMWLMLLIVYCTVYSICIYGIFALDNANNLFTNMVVHRKPQAIVARQKTVSFKKVIKSQTPIMLSQRVCNFNPAFCHISEMLAQDRMLTTRFYRMFTSVILYESGNFNFHRNFYLPYVIGFPQINTRIWNLHKIHKMGFKINSLHELISNPIVALQISETILWNNITVAYSNNPNKNAILDYASSYYGVNMPHNYTKHIAGYYYNKPLLRKTMNRRFKLTDSQIVKDHMELI